MKKIILIITILLSSLFAFGTQAQEIALLKSGSIIDTVIQNAKITEWTGDKSVYVIEFDVVNNLDKDQEGIRYALELYNSTKEQGKFLVDQSVHDEIIVLGPKGRTIKRIKYNFPVSFKGEYELQLLITTKDGVELDRKTLGVISKDDDEGVFIDITKCQSKIGFNEYHIFKEVDLSNEDLFEVRCRDMENLSKNDLEFYPKVVIKDQTKFGEVVNEKILDKQLLKAEDIENFSFQVPVLNDGLYRYKGELVLINKDQEKVSNSIYFSYIVKKDENGNVIQDPNNVETVMEISQIGTDNEINSFPVTSVVVIVVLLIALVLVLVFIFRRFK